MSPAAAGGAHVKTARPVEDHLVRVSPVREVLEKGIDHKEQIWQEESADPLGRLPRKEIARVPNGNDCPCLLSFQELFLCGRALQQRSNNGSIALTTPQKPHCSQTGRVKH